MKREEINSRFYRMLYLVKRNFRCLVDPCVFLVCSPAYKVVHYSRGGGNRGVNLPSPYFLSQFRPPPYFFEPISPSSLFCSSPLYSEYQKLSNVSPGQYILIFLQWSCLTAVVKNLECRIQVIVCVELFHERHFKTQLLSVSKIC